MRGFRELLDHLAALTRNHIRLGDRYIDVLTTPTPTQRRAFDLLGVPIPHTLT